MAGKLQAVSARLFGMPKPVKRDGAPPETQEPTRKDGKGGPEASTAVRLGPLPGRDQYIPSGNRPQQPAQPGQQPAQPQQPTAPTWPSGQPAYPQPAQPGQPVTQVPLQQTAGTTYVPLGPGFTNPQGPAQGTTQVAEAETTAREERPLVLAGGFGGVEGKHASVHYNLSDKTAIGGSYGRIDADGVGINSYTLDLRQYVASEKNWGIYLQPGVHALQNTSGMGKEWGAAGSAQLGLEWRTNSGITFNVFGGGMIDSFNKKVSPTAGFSVGLAF